MSKAEGAFRTIGELAEELGVPQHTLRFWETRFPQLRPIQRAGNRRYYRPEDVALVKRIHSLLGPEGYTVKGAQRLLATGKSGLLAAVPDSRPSGPPLPPELAEELIRIRAILSQALSR